MATKTHFDLIVIGGGPAGYVAAIRAAQLGKSVACVERDKLGGVCLNWGCIPTKALIASAEMYYKAKHESEHFGIKVGEISYDWDKVIGRSRSVSGQLNKGVGFLFKKNKITHFDGHAFIPKAGIVQVFDHSAVEASLDPKRQKVDQDMPAEVRFTSDPKHTITGDKILIATGASPRPLPGAEYDGEKIISSKDAMVLPKKPKKLLVVGSGAIGMEFAFFYNAFGTEVTIVEMVDRVMPIEDADVSKEIAKSFKNQGITIKTGHVTKSIEKTKAGIKATVAKVGDESGKTETIEADHALVAIGVR
ncbi:MAG: FAD-dependent oxidoreductase, partial [Planctomycetota bacterium]